MGEDGCLFRKKIICCYIFSNISNISIFFSRYIEHIDSYSMIYPLIDTSIYLFQFAILTHVFWNNIVHKTHYSQLLRCEYTRAVAVYFHTSSSHLRDRVRRVKLLSCEYRSVVIIHCQVNNSQVQNCVHMLPKAFPAHM